MLRGAVQQAASGVWSTVGKRSEVWASRLPPSARATWLLRGWSWVKIPMLGLMQPRVTDLTAERCAIEVPLNRFTRNHEGVMYIGCLVAGADMAGGLLAFDRVRQGDGRISLLFRDLQADFRKRVEGPCVFTCDDGEAIAEAVSRTLASDERQNIPLTVVATVPTQLADTPAAHFRMTLTMKRRS